MTDTGSGDPPHFHNAPATGRVRTGSSTGLVAQSVSQPGRPAPAVVSYNRQELQIILNVYGRKVAAGEWRDYALDFGSQTAVFSIFRRSSEMPLYRIVKDPRLTRKQGTYSVITATGLILKRGHELDRVVAVLDKRLKLVE